MRFHKKTMRYVSLIAAAGMLMLSACSAVTGSEEEEEPTEYTLTVSADPSEGGSVDPQEGTYEEGAEVTVEATASNGWNFDGWSGDVESSENPLTVTIDSNTDLTANFSEEGDGEPTEYELSVSTRPSEGGSVDPSSGTYEGGEEVTVEATPNDGWNFDGWTGDVESSENPLTFTIDSNTDLTANFTEEQPTEYNLSVSTDPSEGGSVDPSSGTYEEGEEVTVEATPNDGWNFSGWTGDIESSENPLTFNITSDTELTANFEQQDAQAYSNDIEVTDGSNSEMLSFGMDGNATDGYDSGVDEEAPPTPPSGSFYGHFVIPNYNLFADFRPVTTQRTVWELHFDGQAGNTVTLNWNFNPDSYTGTLMLVDDPDSPSVEVDMGSETSYQASGDTNVLYIVQE